MKKCVIALLSLCFLGFHLYNSLAYTAIEDFQSRIKKLEKDITAEEQALLQLKNRHAAIVKAKERLLQEESKAKEKQLRKRLKEKEENEIVRKTIQFKDAGQRKQKRQDIITQQLDAWTQNPGDKASPACLR